MIDLGHRTGLFDAAGRRAGDERRARRPGRAGRALRAGVARRHGDRRHRRLRRRRPHTYTLPAAHAACAHRRRPMNMAPFGAAEHPPRQARRAVVAAPFREGGGVPYSAYRPEFTDVMDAIEPRRYDGLLIDAVPAAGAAVSPSASRPAPASPTSACGTGHALVLLGRAFPASTFVGYDLDDERHRAGAATRRPTGLTNVTLRGARRRAAPTDARSTPSSSSTPSTTRSTRPPCCAHPRRPGARRRRSS